MDKKNSLAVAYAVKKKSKKMAEGGAVRSKPYDVGDLDDKIVMDSDKGSKIAQSFKSALGFAKGGMVDSIMKKKKMAQGGEVEEGYGTYDCGEDEDPMSRESEDNDFFEGVDFDPKAKRKAMLRKLLG